MAGSATQQTFGAYESESVTDTSDFNSMVKDAERMGEITYEKGADYFVIQKTKSSDIHPAPREFSDEEIAQDGVLRFFHYSHLPASLQERSRPFCELARRIVDTTPRNPERTVALRKLLESKDAAVRAGL